MKYFVSLIIVVPVILASCSPGKKDNALQAVLADLHSSDSVTRVKAKEKLGTMELSPAQQTRLLIEAAKLFPGDSTWPSIPVLLIEKATERPSGKQIAAIKTNFPLYSGAAKPVALQALVNIDTRESVELYAQLVMDNAGKLDYLPTNGLSAKAGYAGILYPSFLKHASHPTIGPEVLLLLLNYLDTKAIAASQVQGQLNEILNAATLYRADVLKASTTVTDIWESDEYQAARRNAGITADLLGYFKTQEAAGELRQYLLLKDHHVSLFAAKSLLRMGEKVDAGIINAIAADPETRSILYDAMKGFGRENEFPATYRTQAAFAESDMVNWLIYPTELARKPDAIELMKVVKWDGKTSEGDGNALFYLYRFRSAHGTWKDDGWMAGVSGYYSVADTPTTDSKGYSFSAFEKWEAKTAEQHLQHLVGIVGDANEKHASTGK